MNKTHRATVQPSEANATRVQDASPATEVSSEIQVLQDWELVEVGGGDNIPVW
jgi:hypothetical protein